jgi:DNA-binding CsgD family transcriptional regulator
MSSRHYSMKSARLRATAIDARALGRYRSAGYLGAISPARAQRTEVEETTMLLIDDCRAMPPASPEALADAPALPPRVSAPELEGARLAALWSELVSGLCRIERSDMTSEYCSFVVSRSPKSQAIRPRDRQILERSLLEGGRKSVGTDFSLSPSGVSEVLRRNFELMGLACWSSRIPMLLVLAAHAHRGLLGTGSARSQLMELHFSAQTVTAHRPDSELSAELSPAQFAVVRQVIEGKSHAEIAALRRTSTRTVANQLAAVFEQLDVSGRAELLCLLARRRLAVWQGLDTQPSAFALAEPANPIGLAILRAG